MVLSLFEGPLLFFVSIFFLNLIFFEIEGWQANTKAE